MVEAMLSEKVFLDLVIAYSSAGRVYHTLNHIQQVLKTIEQMRSLTLNLPTIQLAAWFHDVIYDSIAKDNEEKSAEYAEVVLNSLKIPKTIIAQVKNLILYTKTHQAQLLISTAKFFWMLIWLSLVQPNQNIEIMLTQFVKNILGFLMLSIAFAENKFYRTFCNEKKYT
jgi:hypothetical protein